MAIMYLDVKLKESFGKDNSLGKEKKLVSKNILRREN